ncbi:FecR domain-containing protein [Pelobium sp.]|nr:FecR family protein [Pelobium sp.]MDA9554983.1 FecR domain-containing protein [Pelobium sp.]
MNNLNKKDWDDPIDFINQLKPKEAQKSKAQVWAELEQMMDKPLPKTAKVGHLFVQKWSVAASIALLISLTIIAFLRFYTVNVDCLAGEQKMANLPDGSTVQLNAKSNLSFHPLWWKINREVKLDGEGFFKVKKGQKFTVISDKGTTSVMGTSFNIFAREDDYEVTCLTGKVRVKSLLTKDEVIITPNQMVSLNQTGKLNANYNVNATLALDWTMGKFVFTQTPLRKVLAEIGRRYGVDIKGTHNLNQLYTGNFDKQKEIEPILALVCKPFDIEYKKLPSGAFIME